MEGAGTVEGEQGRRAAQGVSTDHGDLQLQLAVL
jgi:hypothetical protein